MDNIMPTISAGLSGASTAAQAEYSVDIVETRGNAGNTGNTCEEPAENACLEGINGVSPAESPTGNTGNTAPIEAPHPSGDDDATERDAHGPAPFARLTDADRVRAAAIPAGRDGRADNDDELIMMPCRRPVPPPSDFRFGDLPEPSRLWVYRTAQGTPLAVVARYDVIGPDGTPTKDVRPWTYGLRKWVDSTGANRLRQDWHCKAPPTPRPLFGLDRLAADPSAPVLVTEGEKAAEAASAIFPNMVCITSLGGSKAPGKTDWEPLRGRNVTIWPDQDEAGADYATKVADLARRVEVASVRVVEVPTDWPKGWDLADALPNGVVPRRLQEILEDAPDSAAVELPNGFSMLPKGLFFQHEATEKNPDPPLIFIAAAFRVLGETRSDVGESWGLLLRWRDREGRLHQWAIPRRLIHRPGNEIAEQLEHAGLSCGPDARAHDLLKRFVGGVKAPRLLRCVTRTGWHAGEVAPVFVLPGGEAFGRGAADTILQADHASADAAYRAHGNLAGWQSGVALLAVGNDRLALFVAAALAGPLLDVLAEQSGGLHLYGDSRTGKSTAAVMAASVWGKPTSDAQVRSWRGTANGLEGTAAETTDALLILDEMGQADGREVGDVVYMLANEAGKQRASRTGTARPRQSWRILFLSTGEITLPQKMGEVGKRAMSGLEVRLVNLPANAGAGMGVFQDLHGRSCGAALADELKSAAREHYGVAARAFLARLAHDRAANPIELRDTLNALRERFMADYVPDGASGQVRSVASRFATIAAAGELARDYGVLPWPEGEAMRATGACFAAWLAERGGAGSGEDTAALAQVRAFLEAHGESRFTLLAPDGSGCEPRSSDATRTINRAGWRRRVSCDDGGWEYLILPETFKHEVCKGLDVKRTADLLAERGLLMGGDDRHRSTIVRIRGEGTPRVYLVPGAILGGDTMAGGDGAC